MRKLFLLSVFLAIPLFAQTRTTHSNNTISWKGGDTLIAMKPVNCIYDTTISPQPICGRPQLVMLVDHATAVVIQAAIANVQTNGTPVNFSQQPHFHPHAPGDTTHKGHP